MPSGCVMLTGVDAESTVAALGTVIYGSEGPVHARVHEAVAALGDLPRSDITYAQHAAAAYPLLRAVITKLGGSACAIAADTQLRGVLCEWAAIAAPRLMPVLSGHFDLAIGAILALGDGSDYQQRCLAELDCAEAFGALMLTELGGTNGADQQTTATWDATIDGFWLTTPTPAAAKFMPNVADPHVPKTVVVTARMILAGRDEGVLPFLLRLRTSIGLVDGVRVVTLPGKVTIPMDHGLIRFDRVRLPRQALLGGNWARLTADGRLDCALPTHARFRRAISVLDDGRVDLPNAAVASARAGLVGLVNYTRQRRPRAGGTLMADRDAVQRDLATAVAEVYATSVLGRCLRAMRTDPDSDPDRALWPMLGKPLLSETAYRVLQMCQRRAAAQGMLRINYLPDWIGNIDGIITAEGENQIMQVAAGRACLHHTLLQLPATPTPLPWYIDLLTAREHTLANGLRRGDHHTAGPVPGPDSAAIELATTTAERLAATALAAAATTISDPHAIKLASSAASTYALERIYAHSGWYTTHQLHSWHDTAPAIASELNHHRQILIDHLPAMVAAFDIPALPAAPLFSPNYIQAWTDYADWNDQWPCPTSDPQ
jgi:alkylation response protein AidB-like acyl-CoA dehydrogenase